MLIGQDEFESMAMKLGIHVADVAASMYRFGRAYEIPDQTGTRNYLTKSLVKLLLNDSMAVGILEWGIWPSSENPSLFYTVRKSQGIALPVNESNYEVIHQKDEEYALALIGSCFMNFWEFLILDVERGNAFFVSHDEWMNPISANHDFLTEWDSICQYLHVREILLK